MNKKKIATLLLVGTLVVGGGVLGTKAWFTSKADATSNLRVTMGTLKLVANGDDAWTVGNQISSENPESESTTEVVKNADGIYPNNDFKNVRPGDDFVKKVTLKNVGSLKAKTTITVDNKAIPEKLQGKLTVKLTDKDGNALENKTTTIIPDGEEIVNIKVALNGPEMGNEFEGPNASNFVGVLHGELVSFLNSDIPFINIDGTQVNNK